MHLALDTLQQELQQVARDVVDKECPPSLVRAVVAGTDDGHGLWSKLVDLGWPGLAIAEEHGGTGLGPLELILVVEQLGRGADPTPFLATTTQFAPLVEHCGDADQQADLLAAVVAGGTGTVAWDGASTVTATPDGDGWRLDGTARFVLDGDRVDHVAVVATTPDGPRPFLVSASDVVSTRQPTFDGSLHIADVSFDGVTVPPERVLSGDGLAAAHALALAGLSAHTVGASQRIFDLALDHIKHRHQFGVPIGSFQALKHMAVDAYVHIERARVLAQFAAVAVGDGLDRAGNVASMAKAAAGECQKLVAHHGIQFFGGLGFTWENDVQIFVRRAKSGGLLMGNAAEHRVAVARTALSGAGTIRLSFDEAAEAFRRELSDWLDENTPGPDVATERSRSSAHVPEWSREWQRKLFDAGYLVPGNPPEFGGRNATLLEQFVHLEEMQRRGITPTFNTQGLTIIVPSILAYGTEEQKRRWALPILRAEFTASLGMSEPDAGSDLAALRTRAVRDGDSFVVNGQKVWTSGAHDSEVIFTFVRTDPDAPKHKGISVLLIPTDTPGVTCRPFGSIIGPDELDFNEVFFDDAVVPAENLVGPLNGGWGVANGSLGHERAMLWQLYAAHLDELLVTVRAGIAERGLEDDTETLAWYGRLALNAQALWLLGYRTLGAALEGAEAREQSILKLFGSDALHEAVAEALEMVGPDGLDPSGRVGPRNNLGYDHGGDSRWTQFLRAFPSSIAGGTSQIQRNIVSERVLGLPR